MIAVAQSKNVVTLPTFTLAGAPRTKKTHPILIPDKSSAVCQQCGQYAKHKIIPSTQHNEWFDAAMWQSANICRELRRAGTTLPIMQFVGVSALFYRDRYQGDLIGYEQALADWLQAPRENKAGKQTRKGAGIIDDDALIVSWDGSHLLKDAVKPRIEVTIHIFLDDQIPMQLEEEW